MNNFFYKYRLYISVAIYFIVVSGVSYFGIYNLVNIIAENANDYQKKIIDEDSRKKRLNDLPKLKEQYEMVERDGKKIDVLLNKDETINLIKRIEEIGNQTENTVKIQIDENMSNFGTDDDKKTKKKDSKKDKEELLLDQFSDSKYLDVKLVLEGKYNNILNFIKKIENIEYHADILAISLKKPEINENANSSGGLFGGGSNPADNNVSQAEKQREPDALDGNVEVIFYLK